MANSALECLHGLPSIADSAVQEIVVPGRAAELVEFPPGLPKELISSLANLGITNLYSHQAQSIASALQGSDVLLSTGTSSGKTLGFAIPMVHMLSSEPLARALVLYPTKALAQDQLGKFDQLLGTHGIRVGTYDGDTPKNERSLIRKTAQIVLTNPDMLHLGILPGHENWISFLKSLRLIVLDEVHSYRGVFGSHVGHILRRLLRQCERYGSFPQIIGASATIGNPDEHFWRLTGRSPVIVSSDGSPQGDRTFALVQPGAPDGRKPSPNRLAAQSLVQLIEGGFRSLVFCRSRLGVELVLRYARDEAEKIGVDPRLIESYRAGYTISERRSIEQAFFSGKIKGLISTSAMELGVDVGGIDVVIINGFPGTVSGFRQQAGRVARGGRPGLIVYLAHEDPLETWLLSEPDHLIKGLAEPSVIQPENRTILGSHLMCAAHERPISGYELGQFGESAVDCAEALDRSGELAFQNGQFFYPAYDSPASKVDIRGVGGGNVILTNPDAEIGVAETWRAKQSLHPGAIYLHRGAAFLVEELDLEKRIARLIPFSGEHTTMSLVQSTVEPLKTILPVERAPGVASLEAVRVTTEVLGYKRLAPDGVTAMSVEELSLPADELETIGVRIHLKNIEIGDKESLGALHGAEHALLAMAPFHAGCDRGDLGSTWYVAAPDTLVPAIFAFDRCPGGIGLSERLYASWGPWLWSARVLLERCICENGCPKCLYSSRCEISNENLNKSGALKFLIQLLESDFGLDG